MSTLNKLREQNPNIVECKVFIDKETGVLYFAIGNEEEKN